MPGYQNYMKWCLAQIPGCINGICAECKDSTYWQNERLYDPWWYAQTFRPKRGDIDANVELLNMAWWLGNSGFEGEIITALMPCDEEGNIIPEVLLESFKDSAELPVYPEMEKIVFDFEEFLLQKGQIYAMAIHAPGSDEENEVVVRNNRPGSYPYGSYTFSWDNGISWIEPTTEWDFYFEVYGCIYQS